MRATENRIRCGNCKHIAPLGQFSTIVWCAKHQTEVGICKIACGEYIHWEDKVHEQQGIQDIRTDAEMRKESGGNG